MRPSINQRPRPLLSTKAGPILLLALGALIQSTLANPYPKDDIHNSLGFGYLMDRSCVTYCGADNQYCCSENEACTTNDGNVAGCTNTAEGGGYGLYTTTWTETDTFTSTISSYYAVSTAVGTCTPPSGSGWIACGAICCASWQYCAYDGQCSASAGATVTGTTAWTAYTTTMTTAGSTITTQFSAPYRVTSGSETTATGTLASATTTGSVNGTAVTTGGSHLSGGAIAGIVIGTLAGIALLLAICACCLVRGLWHGLLAIFGLGPRKKKTRSSERETVIIEEERRRHGTSAAAAGHTRRERHDGWFASRPSGRSQAESRRTSEKKKETGSNAGWLGAGALGTLLLMLGLRRDKKRRDQPKRPSRVRSEVSSSYFSDSYTAGGPSELSSDRTYSSVYTRPTQSHTHARGPPMTESVVRTHTVRSASGAPGRVVRDDYAKSNVPPDYAGSASSGGRTRGTRRSRSRRTDTTRISRAPSRR